MDTMNRWKTAAITLSAGALVFLGACSSGDEDATPEESATPVAEATTAGTTTTESPTPTEAAPTAEPTAEASALAVLDGLACTGEWRNETFGSTGSFAATFDVGEDGGNVSLELGGNVFGGQGGTVDAPLTVDGETTVIDADLGFLGQAMFRFDGATPVEASLGSPPALGPGSDVTLTDVEFTGEVLNASVEITFPDGSKAHSVLESTCS